VFRVTDYNSGKRGADQRGAYFFPFYGEWWGSVAWEFLWLCVIRGFALVEEKEEEGWLCPR
jgi:hypothetical protein